jgi:hypothetical protein
MKSNVNPPETKTAITRRSALGPTIRVVVVDEKSSLRKSSAGWPRAHKALGLSTGTGRWE